MFTYVLLPLASFAALIYFLGPLAVRWTFRVAARCRPLEVPLETLPEKVAELFEERIPEMRELEFAFAGSYDCGSLARETRSYIAYFRERRSGEVANVTVLVSPNSIRSYLEFSTRFTNGLVLETNSNRTLPLTPPSAEMHVFRFPEIQDAQALLEAHRQIIDKYAYGLRPQSERNGAELERFVHVVENYGPRHCKLGYMCLDESGEWYMLTWKGAFLTTWRGLWPILFVRRWVHRLAMNSERHSLEARGLRALQKA